MVRQKYHGLETPTQSPTGSRGTYVNHEKLRFFEPAGRLAELVVYICVHSQKKKKKFLTSITQLKK
jgi:hypothetical protein